MNQVRWYIKVITDNKIRFHIQQGKSDTDIAQQPEDGFASRREAEAHLNKLRETKSLTVSFRKEWRKR